MDTKDRLIVDVTDEGQANGQFRTLADNLIFDLSEHKGQINRLYFENNNICNSYSKNIEELYRLAKNNPVGADYWTYFRRNMSRHIQKSTLFDNYRNVLIIITDGYLEAVNHLYTGDLQTRKRFWTGKTELKIPDIAQKFPTLEVLVLEVKERTKYSPQEPKDKGTPEDYDILYTLWKDWFKRLEIKNVEDNFFIYRNNATILTQKEIDKFLNSN